MKKRIQFLRKALCSLMCLFILVFSTINGIDSFVQLVAQNRILSPQQATELTDVDCILVLGCLVQSDGTPSDMLSDRLRRGVELYGQNAAPKLLMSGDHGREDYNEVHAMKAYAVDSGIASENIFMDHA